MVLIQDKNKGKGMEWSTRSGKEKYFPLNFDQNKYELLSKTWYMKNYKSYSYDCNIKSYCLGKKKIHFTAFRTSFMPKWKYHTFWLFPMKMIFTKGKWTSSTIVHTKKITHHSVLWNYHLSSCRRQYNCYSFISGAGKISIFLFHNFS